MGRIVTFGEALGMLRAREVGSLAHLSELAIGTAGAEANVAIGVARLGGSATWLGRVGSDGLGRRVVRELRAEGIDVRAIIDDSAPTGLLLKESPTAGRTVVSYYRAGSAGSRLAPDDLAELDLTTDDILHVTGITPALSSTARAATDRAIDMAHAVGATVSFDVNHRSRLWASSDEAGEVYRGIAARAHTVFAGEDEAALVAPAADPRDPAALAHAVAAWGPREVVIKRGAAGALALVDGRIVEQAAIAVNVVDTVGAGDAFVAGYLVETLAGLAVEDRLATAVRCGAAACQHPGDWEGLPTRADLAANLGSDPVTR
ncbi:sugar kinase [soil metagenome]